MNKIDDRIAKTRADVEILMEEYRRQVRLGLIKDIKLTGFEPERALHKECKNEH